MVNPETSLNQPLLDTPASAQRLGISTQYLEKLRVTGGGPKFVKIGRAVRYRPEDLDEYISARIRTNTSMQ